MPEPDAIDARTVMKATKGLGLCPPDCDDQRLGPHWHNYLDDLRAAGFVVVPNNSRLLGIRVVSDTPEGAERERLDWDAPQPSRPTLDLLETTLGPDGPPWRNARCRCGHREALHRHPLWFWRWWAKRPRTPFACAATIWNMAHTDERRCVCTGFRAVHIGGGTDAEA